MQTMEASTPLPPKKAEIEGRISNEALDRNEHAEEIKDEKEHILNLNIETGREEMTVKDKQKLVSADEIRNRKDDIFKRLNEAIEKILKTPDLRDQFGNFNEHLPNLLNGVSEMFFEFKRIGPLSYDVFEKYLQEVGRLLSRTGSTGVLCRIIIDGWRIGKRNPDFVFLDHYETVDCALSILVNTSDRTPEVTYDIVEEPNFLETLRDILTSSISEQLATKKDVKKADDEEKKKVKKAKISTERFLDVCLTIIHNTSVMTANTQRLRDLEFVRILILYLDAINYNICLNALSTIANIINEEESALLQDKHDVIEFLLETLGSALDNENHRCAGWSAQELVLTIRRLGRNDANKKLLVEMLSLPYLVALVKCGKVEEQREAVEAIWVLAFDKDNQKKMLKDKELNIVETLVDLKRYSEDKEVKKAVDGALWILQKDIQDKNMVHLYESLKESTAAVKGNGSPEEQENECKKGHIMISYNWSHQEQLMKIRDVLKEHGYSVWMDIENMGDYTLQAMAEAVEEAQVVLMSMSQKYKDSPNCRAEAEYAYQLRKEIIPLKMERDFKPDGWLGFIVGAKLFYDFSGEYSFDITFKALLKEIVVCFGNSRRQSTAVFLSSPTVQDTFDFLPPPITHKTPLSALRHWTTKQVEQWIVKHNLPKKRLGGLTGRDLAALVKMRKEAPEFFYKYLFKKLQISSLSTVDIFTEALEDMTV